MSTIYQPSADVDLGDRPGHDHGLSAREAEVIALITQGLANEEIASRIFCSINTVKSYIRAAYRKIGVHSRAHAVLWGVDHGFRPDTIRAMAPDDSQRLEIGSPRQLSPPRDHARRPGPGLLDALHHWRDTAWTPTSERHVSEHRAIDANRATIERAKGALMRRYGMDSFQAFSLMVRWARLSHTPVHIVAKTLAQDIDEADSQPERRHSPLIRWLEGQLRPVDL